MDLFKTTIDLKWNIKKKGSIEKALGYYLPAEADDQSDPESSYFKDLRGLILKQPDLLYALSIFVSEGVNKNKDAFLRSVLARIYQSPRNKFVDYEHDEEGQNDKGQNPEEYQIVGHIYDSQLALQKTGETIPDYDVFKDEDGDWFGKDSKWRDQPLDIIVAWVLYKFQYPELADLIVTSSDDPGFGVSMEILFSDYKFRIGGPFDPTEDFDFDANSLGITEVRKGEGIAEQLKKNWDKGIRTWNGLPVIRILGGDIFFSGMAITSDKANNRSWNISVASVAKNLIEEINIDDSKKELVGLIKAVASKSKNFDFSTCNIINGEPDCECLTKTVSSEVEMIKNDIDELLTTIAKISKRKDISPKSGEHKYGDVKFADPTNKKYPIDTEEHIRAAWNYINHAGNAAKYSSSEVRAIKSRIVSAWKSKVDKAGPPSAKDKSKGSSVCPLCSPEVNDSSSEEQSALDEHISNHMNVMQSGLKVANMKLQNLYENNIGGDLNAQEMREFVEEVDSLLDGNLPEEWFSINSND